MPVSLTPAARKARASLRKLLKSPDLEFVEQGCALLEVLAEEPELRVIAEELAEGTELDDDGKLVFGEALSPSAGDAHRTLVALWVLRVLGRLDGVQKLDLQECSSLRGVDVLSGLTNLQTLDPRKCRSLTNLDGLAGLTGLETLNLNRCRSLRNVDGLSELTSSG